MSLIFDNPKLDFCYTKSMQRRWFIAVLLAASLVAVSAHAQRGFSGGRVSAPARGPAFAPHTISTPAFGPHSAGPVGSRFSGPPRFVGPPQGRVFAGSIASSRGFVPRRTVFVNTFAPRGGVRVSAGLGFRRFHRFRDFDDFRFGRHFFGFNDFRFRRPFFFGGGCFSAFNPFCNQFFFGSTLGFGGFGYPSYPAYAADYSYQAPPQQVVVESDNSRELAYEVERLTDEVQLLRDEDIRRNNESRAAALQNQGSMSAKEPPAYTVLVFRDGHKQSVQNYAVAGDTLWVITEQAAKKVPLSEIDIPATQQANSANGVDFKVPSKSQ